MEATSTTSTATVTPMDALILRVSSPWAASASAGVVPSRRSTRTVRVSRLPLRSRWHWKWGESAGRPSTISSIWVGKRFTPRRMIMSSVRPVIFSIRRMLRAVPGSNRVRSRVR